jgi:hypothetical protein
MRARASRESRAKVRNNRCRRALLTARASLAQPRGAVRLESTLSGHDGPRLRTPQLGGFLPFRFRSPNGSLAQKAVIR